MVDLREGQLVDVDIPPLPRNGHRGGRLHGRVLGWPKRGEYIRVVPEDNQQGGYVQVCWNWIVRSEAASE